MNDLTRAAFLAFAQSIFPVLQIAGVISFTGDQVAVIMACVGNGLTLLALVYKTGQERGPSA